MFFDIRHYARISPSGRINVRLVGGGWVGGDPLPLQRRLSLGGPDPMPGHPFRATACNNAFTDPAFADARDRKSTRLNSSHGYISYAVFCLKKKTKKTNLAYTLLNTAFETHGDPSC